VAIVRVPGSSANLGSGFDGVGLAVSMYAEVGVVGVDVMPERARPADERHPATIACRRAGGSVDLWVRSEMPMGRGLGFSGAVRVAGALLGLRDGTACDPTDRNVRREVLDITATLEGHADNVAASLLGGVVGTNGHEAARLVPGCPLDVVVWIPEFTTSTNESRAKLPNTVPFADAVFNVTHTALLMAALASGDVGALSEATADRMHQDVRLAKVPTSRAALESMTAAGAVCAWLSGSGPTVACFVRSGEGSDILGSLPSEGQARILSIDTVGATFR
jgi:homoserine kinase